MTKEEILKKLKEKKKEEILTWQYKIAIEKWWIEERRLYQVIKDNEELIDFIDTEEKITGYNTINIDYFNDTDTIAFYLWNNEKIEKTIYVEFIV